MNSIENASSVGCGLDLFQQVRKFLVSLLLQESLDMLKQISLQRRIYMNYQNASNTTALYQNGLWLKTTPAFSRSILQLRKHRLNV